MSQSEHRAMRRRLLIGGLGVAGALVVGWSVLPPRQRLHADPPAGLPADMHPLNGWVMVAADGRVRVMLAKSEMGQGVMTSLAMLVAEEMDVPLSSIELMQAPLQKIFGDQTIAAEGLPFRPDDEGVVSRSARWVTRKLMREVGVIATGGSTSVRDCWLPMREAGAAARARLVAAAAQQWKVAASECRTGDGKVMHASGRSAGYGELAARAAQIAEVPWQLKEVSQFTLIGRPQPRLDGPSKVNGGAQFGMDVRIPGMLYAMVAMPPVLGGRLKGFDAASVERLPGVVRVLALTSDRSGSPDAVAVVADSRWRAMQAAKRLNVSWDDGKHAQLSSPAIIGDLRRALDQEAGFTYYRSGDIDALQGATRLSAEYRVPHVAHAAMEPVNCSARWAGGRLKLWAPTQSPSVAATVASRAAGVGSASIDLTVTMLGGGFGRRLDNDMVAQVAQIARALDGPAVQLMWTREQDIARDFFRPAAVARLQGTLDASGHLTGLESTSAGASPAQHLLHRAFGLPMAGPDKTTVEGLYDQPYEIAHQKVSHVITDSAVPVGSWRSVGHSHNAFFMECFIDELAQAAGVDEIDFRRKLLSRHPRELAVLDAAVALAGVAAAGRALGVALHRSFGTIVAQVAEVSVDGSRIRVHSISCAVDCGIVVNPDGVAQQVESSVAMGLSCALHDEIVVRNGRVLQSNFHDYRTLRITDMPEVRVTLLQSAEPPGGMGEPATPPVAPAVANAVFKLTGKRLRSLPLRLDAG